MNALVFIRKAAILVLGVGLLASCQRFIPNPIQPSSVPSEAPIIADTGNEPSITVDEQNFDGKTVVIKEVFSEGPGWVAIHVQKDGQAGESIGHAQVKDGLNENVVVALTEGQPTEVMYAMLHIDAGVVGTYEFPGADVPEAGESQKVSPQFRVTLTQPSLTEPVIEISDQAIVGGLVKVARVVSNGPGWVVIHDDHGGKAGDAIGWTAVKNGENLNVTVTVDTGHMSSLLYAILQSDAGEIGVPEFPSDDFPSGVDVPQTNNQQPVSVTFLDTNAAVSEEESVGTQEVAGGAEVVETAGAQDEGTATGHEHGQVAVTPGSDLVPVVIVSDQDIQNDQVVVDKIFSVGPGWVSIYSDDENGEPAERLGYAPVVDGENLEVAVPIDSSKVTPRLHAILHVDTGQIGTFEYPQADPPVHVEVRMIRNVFHSSAQTAESTEPAQPEQAALSVRVEDQPIRGGIIKIDEVFSKGPGWIGVHLSNPDGSLSHSAIGAGHVNAGLNKDVIVKLTNLARATELMFAMLHVDEGQIGVYEYPSPAIDVPVLIDGVELIDDFRVTSGLTGQDLAINIQNSGDTPYLVDSQGYSLYTLSIGECQDDCLDNWLPLLVTSKVIAGEGVFQQKLGIAALGNGNRQVTYGNLPLFYYIGDTVPGETLGQGIDGEWFLARP